MPLRCRNADPVPEAQQLMFPLVRKADRECNSADKNQANGPSKVQIEPRPRHEFETQIAVDQPRRESPRRDHRGRVDDRDQNGNAETGIDEGACRLVASIGIGGLTKAKINRHEHQARAMRDCHGEGPKRQLRRSYPRQRPWMTSVEEPEDAETDDQ